MTLAAGTRLGPYEIVAPLGAGGMGEVYRARDTRLGRDVAVKVLPQHLSSNPEVRARFEREAKSVSALNHPNICTLHDVGREGDTDFLVMELVEGETLAQRLTRGALPAADLLKIGVQIADALERAHRAGVVHRDLKPGNVMLTRAGAKLMDFGLARATGLAPSTAGFSGSLPGTMTQSPTIAAALTAEGTLIGTFQYMSPEQLEGKEADERSDLWAFGCVLYEMATGRRAFEGRSQASLITAIMGTEPPPVSQVAPLAPPGLDRLVRTCLTKDPEDRARSAHDVKLQLQGIAEGNSQTSLVGPNEIRPARPAAGVAFVAGLAVAALAITIALVARRPPPASPVRLTLLPAAGQEIDLYAGATQISPDGRFVAYVAADSSRQFGLWLRRLDSYDATLLAVVGPATGIFWAADGRRIGVFGTGARQILTVPVEGGTPTVVTSASGGRGATWNRNGVILYAASPQGPLFRISASGGEPVQVTWPDSARHESGHRFPCFLPDGDHFLFVALPAGPAGFRICAGSLSSHTVKPVMVAQSAAVYAPPGDLLFRRAGKLMAQSFDARTLSVHGEPVPLGDAPPETDLDAEPIASASRDGRLVVLESPVPDAHLSWMDLHGKLLSTLPLPAGPWGRIALSPDDRYAVIENGDDLWRIDLSRSVPLRLTSGGGYYSNPVWSPDGRRIAFTRGRQGREEIDLLNADGSGTPQVLPTTPDLFKNATDWSSAGVIVQNIDPTTFRDLWLMPTSKSERPKLLVGTPFGETEGRVSPDGRWIAYISNEAGTNDIYLQSFPEPGHKTRVSSGGADRIWWLPGSDGLVYPSTTRREMMSVKLTRHGDDVEVGEPQTLFPIGDAARGADLSHDGRRLLVSLAPSEAASRSIHVLLNWTGLLK